MGYRLDSVSFSYGDKTVLDSLTLDLAEGRFYGILGPNGSGKTTLLDLLNAHRRPDAGTVLFRRRPLQDYGKKELARHLALVPQNFYVNFPFTVEEVVLMGRYPHMGRFGAPSAQDFKVVERVLELTDIAHFRDRYVTELSGGERQRVVFARALAQQTPVLLLDEATSNMDVRHGLQMLQLARHRTLSEAATVIAVFQDINLAALFCDVLVFLRQGRLVAQGESSKVLTGEIIEAVFDVKAEVELSPGLGTKSVRFSVPPLADAWPEGSEGTGGTGPSG